MNKRNKIFLILSIAAIAILSLVGITYAYYTFQQTGATSDLIVGDIYMHYKETDKTINIIDAFPSKIITNDLIEGRYYLNRNMKDQSVYEVQEIDSCVNYMINLGFTTYMDSGTTIESFCKGEGTANGGADFKTVLSLFSEDDQDVKNLLAFNVVVKTDEGIIPNPEMVNQEALLSTKCANYVAMIGGVTDANVDNGTTLANFCQGIATVEGRDFETLLNMYETDETMMGLLLSENIIVADGEGYTANPEMIAEKDLVNELSNCVNLIKSYELLDGESYESFCKGEGKLQNLSYKEHQESKTELFNNTYETFSDSNIAIYKDILIKEDITNFEFTIEGKNTYEKKDINYEIKLSYGENVAEKTTRLEDKYLKFTLVEMYEGDQTIVLHNANYEDLSNVSIYKDIITSKEEVDKTYRLYMWISDEVKVCGGNEEGCNYYIDSSEEETNWNNVYASIKVNVSGDFLEKTTEIPLLPETGAGEIMSKLGTGGLVAVNNEGKLYNGSGIIREYRYSGKEVNNYIIFNSDGDDTTEVNELWRIVGVFQNTNGDWNLKLMRNVDLTAEEMPLNYQVNGTNYHIKWSDTSNHAYWNLPKVGTNYNDWTEAGLQYFLNTEQDEIGTNGYYASFTNKAKKLIDENYTYYLGNHQFDEDTTRNSYKNERSSVVCDSSVTEYSENYNCNIWYGNKATWNGKIGLLYPSDYGYSAHSSYWNTLLSYYWMGPMDTSWMYVNDETREWFISPSSNNSNEVSNLYRDGSVYWDIADNYNSGLRPALNLISGAQIDGNHEGSINDPYVVIE